MYIQYTMNQLYLPMDLEEDIPENHLVRVVQAAVNRLDDKIFAAVYPGGGRDSYHPKMLTKVIVYAYTQRIYSSRQIAKAVRENVMLWIAGRQRPDFRTINRLTTMKMKIPSNEKTESGDEIEYRHYRSPSCKGWPIKTYLYKSRGQQRGEGKSEVYAFKEAG